jgi:MurNAc alpha-1-phosphate uridylyltransferase
VSKTSDPSVPAIAMVLAAGLGMRMRPLSARQPKPLVEVMGRTLIDHVLDRLAQAGVKTAVVNLHYFADQLEAHLKGRERPRILISDEQSELLNTGGGIRKALPLLGKEPFLLVNADSLWVDRGMPNLVRLARGFDRARMDALLLLALSADTIGYEGQGDFDLESDGRLKRRGEREVAPFIYAGIALVSPALFDGAPEGAFPLSRLFERVQRGGRLHGLRLEGTFLHIGTPAAIAAAEEAIRRASS